MPDYPNNKDAYEDDAVRALLMSSYNHLSLIRLNTSGEDFVIYSPRQSTARSECSRGGPDPPTTQDAGAVAFSAFAPCAVSGEADAPVPVFAIGSFGSKM